MVRRLNSNEANFEASFQELLSLKRETADDVREVVTRIISDIRHRGDAAMLEYTRQFDRFEATPSSIRIDEQACEEAERSCEPDLLAALNFAADRIRSYHEKQLPKNEQYTDETGVTLGWRWTSLDSVGLYVPGGLASYPSSVLMNAIPAQVAGVKRLVMTAPAPGGQLNPLVLAAARRAGVKEIYKVGGAQAIAALAWGTDLIPAVDKVVGPGNAFVAEAKRQVFGKVGIDSIAGPSEILVVADKDNDPEWIAADLLSQAEHDPSSQSILITTDSAFADQVSKAAESQIAASQRHDIVRAAWQDNSAIIVVCDLTQASELVNRLAPEHLELAIENPYHLLPQIRHAGAIFLGRYTPEAVGDYVAGPDHVLPTAQAARYTSGLSVLDFLKRSSIIGCTPEALQVIGPAAAKLADAEGLPSHAHSVRVRLRSARQ